MVSSDSVPCAGERATPIVAVLPSRRNGTSSAPSSRAKPVRNAPDSCARGSGRPQPSTSTNAATAARTMPPTRRGASSPRACASSQKPSSTSTAAASMIPARTPASGTSTCTISSTPAIAPRVLAAYNRPIAASPAPPRSSARVNSGRVMPAKNAAGSITAIAITALPSRYSR